MSIDKSFRRGRGTRRRRREMSNEKAAKLAAAAREADLARVAALKAAARETDRQQRW